MSFNRIQKLLFAEYRDFEDMVLVESPFAQTTRDGEGLRQVHLGKLSDFDFDVDSNVNFDNSRIDPNEISVSNRHTTSSRRPGEYVVHPERGPHYRNTRTRFDLPSRLRELERV